MGQPRDCPLCHCVWDIADFATDELTRARTYHLAAFHSTAEMLDALDVLWARIRSAEAAATPDCVGAT